MSSAAPAELAITLAAGIGGFSLLQAGLCRPKNSSSVIISNLLCVGIAAILYWATGFAFAFGTSSNVFLSHSEFFLIDATDSQYLGFGQQFVLCALLVVIMNGGFSERMRFWVYPILTFFVAGFLYPVATHWAYETEGWLRKGVTGNDGATINYRDAGYAGILHVSAGSVALIGTLLLGKRKVYDDFVKVNTPIGGQVNTHILTGGMLAYLSLFMKNIIFGGTVFVYPRAFTNCILASTASLTIAFFLKRTKLFGHNWNSRTLINGALIGLVSVSAAPGEYHAYAAFVIGVVAGLTYVAYSAGFQLCRVDDPIDTITVHLGGGFWGVLARPIFHVADGIVYSGDLKHFQMFGWNFLGATAVFVWMGLTTFVLLIMFLLTRYLKYDKDHPALVAGLDVMGHNEPAYPAKTHYPPAEPKNMFDTFMELKHEGQEYVDNGGGHHNGVPNNGYTTEERRQNGGKQFSKPTRVATDDYNYYRNNRQQSGF